jgi:hypothetical protein
VELKACACLVRKVVTKMQTLWTFVSPVDMACLQMKWGAKAVVIARPATPVYTQIYKQLLSKTAKPVASAG